MRTFNWLLLVYAPNQSARKMRGEHNQTATSRQEGSRISGSPDGLYCPHRTKHPFRESHSTAKVCTACDVVRRIARARSTSRGTRPTRSRGVTSLRASPIRCHIAGGSWLAQGGPLEGQPLPLDLETTFVAFCAHIPRWQGCRSATRRSLGCLKTLFRSHRGVRRGRRLLARTTNTTNNTTAHRHLYLT